MIDLKKIWNKVIEWPWFYIFLTFWALGWATDSIVSWFKNNYETTKLIFHALPMYMGGMYCLFYCIKYFKKDKK